MNININGNNSSFFVSIFWAGKYERERERVVGLEGPTAVNREKSSSKRDPKGGMNDCWYHEAVTIKNSQTLLIRKPPSKSMIKLWAGMLKKASNPPWRCLRFECIIMHTSHNQISCDKVSWCGTRVQDQNELSNIEQLCHNREQAFGTRGFLSPKYEN